MLVIQGRHILQLQIEKLVHYIVKIIFLDIQDIKDILIKIIFNRFIFKPDSIRYGLP